MSDNILPIKEEQPPKTLEQRLAEADILEKERSREFLEQSRPKLMAGKSLPWDRFWAWFGGGLDGFIWRWVAPDVEVARARENAVSAKKSRGAKKRADSVSTLDPGSQSPQIPDHDESQ